MTRPKYYRVEPPEDWPPPPPPKKVLEREIFVEKLRDALKAVPSIVASCTCTTKTPDWTLHDTSCKYRLNVEITLQISHWIYLLETHHGEK